MNHLREAVQLAIHLRAFHGADVSWVERAGNGEVELTDLQDEHIYSHEQIRLHGWTGLLEHHH